MKPSGPQLTDLTNCDREPIHTPGSIQPHGFLLVLDPADGWRVVGASTNARDHFWREATSLIGTEVSALLGTEVVDRLEVARAQPDFPKRALLVGAHAVESAPGRPFTLVAHASGSLVILEGERAAVIPPEIEQNLQAFLGRLGIAESIDEIQRLAVHEIRRVTGFDRCLLYQFDADWNGTVVAEDRNSQLPAYLNQRFPASDIPRQARDLYLRNRVRLIPTNTYTPVPVLLKNGARAVGTLDLSLSVLRSVSPIHLEYMRNMGTGSSMSVAVMRGGELWGLLSCHSREPRHIPFVVRTECDLIAQMLSLQLAARERTRELTYRMELSGVLSRVLAGMARGKDPFAAAHGEDLLRLGAAAGVALVDGDRVLRHGRTPAEEEVRELAAWFAGQDKPMAYWDSLVAVRPDQSRPEAAGLLAIMLRAEPPAAILWFRPELIEVVEWGGEPRKAIEKAGEGHALHPRKSFEVWRETVRDRAKPWEPEVISTARELREAVRAIILQE